MAVIDGIAFDSTTGIAIDGATATLWSGSAFVTPPAKNEPLPGSGLADGPITTGPAYGSDGAYRFEGIPVGDYWISVEVNGEIGWEGASTMSTNHADFTGLTDPGAHPASAISILDAAGDFTADNVESALAELQSDAEAHLADTSDAHDASAISIVDAAGDFTATDVEGALAELQADAEAHLADTTDAHDASAISIADAGGFFTGTDVEAALQELGVFTNWTPALTASGVNPTLGTGSAVSGRFFRTGDHVVAFGAINFGTSGVAAGTGTYLVSLPATMRTPVSLDGNMVGQGYIFDSSTSSLRPCIYIRNSDTTVAMRLTTDGSLVTNAAPWTWAASDVLIFHFDYEGS